MKVFMRVVKKILRSLLILNLVMVIEPLRASDSDDCDGICDLISCLCQVVPAGAQAIGGCLESCDADVCNNLTSCCAITDFNCCNNCCDTNNNSNEHPHSQ